MIIQYGRSLAHHIIPIPICNGSREEVRLVASQHNRGDLPRHGISAAHPIAVDDGYVQVAGSAEEHSLQSISSPDFQGYDSVWLVA